MEGQQLQRQKRSGSVWKTPARQYISLTDTARRRERRGQGNVVGETMVVKKKYQDEATSESKKFVWMKETE